MNKRQVRKIRRDLRPNAPKVAVVIPTKNEAKNLAHVLPYLPDGIFELIIVDAKSKDGTREVAKQLRPDCKIIDQKARGKGSALAAGLCSTKSDIVVMLDADGSMDPREIPAYVGALMAGADLAKGSRAAAGSRSEDITIIRRLGNWGLKTLVNIVFKQKWTELAYGYAAMWTDILEPLDIHKIDYPASKEILGYGHGFEIETLLFTRAARSGLRVVEVSSVEFERIHGHSNLQTFVDGWRVLKSIARERFRYYPVDASEQHIRGNGLQGNG